MKKMIILLAALFSIHAAYAASISISSITIPSSISQGDSFSIIMSVSGSTVTDVSGTLTLPAGISCSPTSSQTISLDGGGSGSATSEEEAAEEETKTVSRVRDCLSWQWPTR